MFIVTPTDHVVALRELNDPQVATLWQTAVGLLESEGIKKFSTMILNHGLYMNHGHLHLKINVTAEDFFINQKNWSPTRQQQWDSLITFNSPKLEKILKKAPYHTNVFVSNLNHAKLGLEVISKELVKYGNILTIIPKSGDMLIVQFETKEGAVKCICEAYAKPIEGCYPQYKWAHH